MLQYTYPLGLQFSVVAGGPGPDLLVLAWGEPGWWVDVVLGARDQARPEGYTSKLKGQCKEMSCVSCYALQYNLFRIHSRTFPRPIHYWMSTIVNLH